MDVSKLSGIELDYAVAHAEGMDVLPVDGNGYRTTLTAAAGLFSLSTLLHKPYSPSMDWEQGGPIIERERIAIEPFKDTGMWSAFKFDTGDCEMRCETPLIAAMRCYVVSKAAPQTQK